MKVTVKVPRLGDTVDLVVIEEWLVSPGDRVAVGQPLVSVETNKASAEVPAPRSGVVGELLVAVDEEVEVGGALCTLMSD